MVAPRWPLDKAGIGKFNILREGRHFHIDLKPETVIKVQSGTRIQSIKYSTLQHRIRAGHLAEKIEIVGLSNIRAYAFVDPEPTSTLPDFLPSSSSEVECPACHNRFIPPAS